MRSLALLCLLCAACGGGDSAVTVSSQPGDPAQVPAGAVAINMEGTWTVTAAVTRSNQQFGAVIRPELTGEELIVERAAGNASFTGNLFELRAFAWFDDVDPAALIQSPSRGYSVRNEGDGRLLIYSMLSRDPTLIGPSIVGWTSEWSIGIALGAETPDRLVGQYYERASIGELVIDFVAERR